MASYDGMTSMKNRLLLLLAIVASAVAPAVAQVPSVVTAPLECLPANGNGASVVAIQPDVEGREIRLYFRRDGFGDFYYAVMEQEEPGIYSGVFPVPEESNVVAEFYVAVLEGGRVVAQSPVRSVEVTMDCEADLTAEQRQRSTQLRIGETSLSQKHRKVAWWECIGVSERIDVFGEVREDTSCIPVGWWSRPEMMVPVSLAGAGVTSVVIVDDEPPGGAELSPVIP